MLSERRPAHYPTLMAWLPVEDRPPGELLEWEPIGVHQAIGLHTNKGSFDVWVLERKKEPERVGSYLSLGKARTYLRRRVEPNPFD